MKCQIENCGKDATHGMTAINLIMTASIDINGHSTKPQPDRAFESNERKAVFCDGCFDDMMVEFEKRIG